MIESNGSISTKKVIIAITIGLILAAGVSFYATGVFLTFSSSIGPSYKLNAVIACIKERGFPFAIFFGMFGCFVLMAAAIIYKSIQDSKGMDVMGRLFRMSVGRKGYGDSHFETPEEYPTCATIQTPEEAYGNIYGQLDLTGTKLICSLMRGSELPNTHMMVIGSSGVGKTYTFSKNYSYQVAKRRESIILTDPDGGLYRDLAGFFQDQGYEVRRFDLNNLMKSDGWDCLKSVYDPDVMKMTLNAQLFAQTVIENVGGGLKTEGIYKDGPMSLLKALILKVMLSPDYPPEQKTIQSVYELLQNPNGEIFLDQIFSADILQGDEKICMGPYLTFKSGSPNLRGNIITNLGVELQLFQIKLVSEILSTDDIDVKLPGHKPCAYFCIFPDNHSTYKFIVSLFFSMLFITLINEGDQQNDGKLPIPVNFLLDEFPSIGTLPDWAVKMATVRKRNINVTMILQNITQLKNNYKDDWETIMSNCATTLALGINDETTAQWLQRRIGETTIEVQTKQHERYESLFSFSHRHSTGEGKRSLMSLDEIMKMSKDRSNCLIIFQGHDPILAKKFPHVQNPAHEKCRTILPDNIPNFTDKSARLIKKENEAIAIEKYLAEHPLSEFDREYKDTAASAGKKRKEKKSLKKLVGKDRDKADNKSGAERQTVTSQPPETSAESECEDKATPINVAAEADANQPQSAQGGADGCPNAAGETTAATPHVASANSSGARVDSCTGLEVLGKINMDEYIGELLNNGEKGIQTPIEAAIDLRNIQAASPQRRGRKPKLDEKCGQLSFEFKEHGAEEKKPAQNAPPGKRKPSSNNS